MTTDKDLYSVLGVSHTASQAEIKKSYRKLARKYHPDVNPGNDKAEQRFKEISAAFDVLGDPDKRKRYDEFGAAGLREGFDPEQARAYQRWSGSSGAQPGAGRGAEGFHVDGFSDLGDLGDLFGDLFGGGRQTARSRTRQGTDIESEVSVDLLSTIRGTDLNLALDRPRQCPACSGTGHRPGAQRPCPDCQGSGQMKTGKGPFRMAMPCQTCQGSGQQPGPPCQACQGSGTTGEQSTLKVTIPPGIQDGGRIRLSGQGNPGQNGGPPGDLYLKVKVQPHPLLRRDGKDLTMTVPVTIGEAIRGAQVEVPIPEGGTVSLTIPQRSQNGRKLRLRGKGVPDAKGRGRGDLYVVLDVRLPSSKSSEVESLASQLDRFYSDEIQRPVELGRGGHER